VGERKRKKEYQGRILKKKRNQKEREGDKRGFKNSSNTSSKPEKT
jgi:hypothetical protein